MQQGDEQVEGDDEADQVHQRPHLAAGAPRVEDVEEVQRGHIRTLHRRGLRLRRRRGGGPRLGGGRAGQGVDVPLRGHIEHHQPPVGAGGGAGGQGHDLLHPLQRRFIPIQGQGVGAPVGPGSVRIRHVGPQEGQHVAHTVAHGIDAVLVGVGLRHGEGI